MVVMVMITRTIMMEWWLLFVVVLRIVVFKNYDKMVIK